MNKIKKFSAFMLAVTLVLSVFSSAAPLEAEASTKATTCQHGGSATTIGYAGCSYCGGSGRNYSTGPRTDQTMSLGIPNEGLNVKTVDMFTYNGINYYNVTLYYRCQNCGDTGYDCKPYDELVYFTGDYRYILPNGTYRYETQPAVQCSAARAQGYVPIRWCSYCGPKLAAKSEPYETVATWAQYHLDPEPTKAPEYSYTITAGTGGSISNSSNQSGSYKQGTSIYAQAVANSGYHFSSWSASGISTPSSSSASFSMPAKSVSLTANFAKNTPTPTSKPGITPRPKPARCRGSRQTVGAL